MSVLNNSHQVVNEIFTWFMITNNQNVWKRLYRMGIVWSLRKKQFFMRGVSWWTFILNKTFLKICTTLIKTNDESNRTPLKSVFFDVNWTFLVLISLPSVNREIIINECGLLKVKHHVAGEILRFSPPYYQVRPPNWVNEK